MPDLKLLRKYWESKILYPELRLLNISLNNVPEELTAISNIRNLIDLNLELLKYNNFWTLPYSNFLGKQAVDLANNLTKEATYTAAGEILLGKLAQGVNKLIPKNRLKNRFIDITLEDSEHITKYLKDKLLLEKENALKYLNSPEFLKLLLIIDKKFNTKYSEALDLLKEKGIKIKYNSNLGYKDIAGEFNYDIQNILNLDKQYINLGPDYTYSTLIHEIKHLLEHIESGLRTGKIKFNNSIELNEVLRSNPRNKYLFDNNLNSSKEIAENISKNNPDRSLDEVFEYIQYIKNPTEINSLLTSLVLELILDGKYTKKLTFNDLEKYAKISASKNDYDAATILRYFIKDKEQFVKDWNNYKYLTPLVIRYGNTRNEK